MKKLFVLILVLSGCSPVENDNLGAPVYSVHDSFQTLDVVNESDNGRPKAAIGFIEFDDLGFQKDRSAVDNVFKNIRTLNENAGADPLLLVVFIHGWHHNAKPDDTNVTTFKRFLQNLQHEENIQTVSIHKRKVVGVYIGWRGESNESVLNPLTYRSRKSAGLRVGQYGLQEVLAELAKIRKSKQSNRLVSIGHSFGGGVLYSSVMQNLVENVVLAQKEGSNQLGTINKVYGDLVILVNPALEAARVEVLNRRLSNIKFADCQPLVFASFTSEYDKALSDVFPLGQKLFFYDDKKIALQGDHEDLVTTPYGNAPSFRTNELSCKSCDYKAEPVYLNQDQYRDAAKQWRAFRESKNAEFNVGNIKLTRNPDSPIQPGTPIMNVYVTGNTLMQDHNDIWGSEFSLFARALIGMEFARGEKCQP